MAKIQTDRTKKEVTATGAWIEPKHPTGDSFLNALADLLLYLDQQPTPQTDRKEDPTP